MQSVTVSRKADEVVLISNTTKVALGMSLWHADEFASVLRMKARESQIVNPSAGT
jgi:hypothetical protein